MIQCYTPAAKRQYGYFPLPILHNGELIGCLDAKVHRKEGVFEVKSVYIENGVPLSETLAHDLVIAINLCSQWHKTPSVVVRDCIPAEFTDTLKSFLENDNLH